MPGRPRLYFLEELEVGASWTFPYRAEETPRRAEKRLSRATYAQTRRGGQRYRLHVTNQGVKVTRV